jgi:SpoVK/Ycf46/Vps4 family AAA+-type ATPase
MSESEDLIAGLFAAVEAQPDNLVLRLHLAGHLIDAGRAGDALAQCEAALAQAPDNGEALTLAVRAAEAADQPDRAKGYRNLADGLAASKSGDDGAPQEPPEEADAEAAAPDNVVPLRILAGGRDGEDDETAEGDLERPKITLAEVGGMESVKRQLNLSFLAPLKNPEYRKMYGKSLRGGLMLYGPPGCGKTFIARATAGELGAKFLSIGLTDVLDMWMGESERNLHELFESARRNAPCVLFLDEIDALGQKRSQLKHSALRSVVNALLAELDGVSENNEGVFVLAATNHPWDVDSALKRPGRLDRTLLVLPPDREARRLILDLHLREKPTEKLDLEAIARRTEGCSGADLALLCETATELAMEQAIDSGEIRPMGMAHFKPALKTVRRSTEAWFETARNYALYANEGGAYDELLAYLRSRKR